MCPIIHSNEESINELLSLATQINYGGCDIKFISETINKAKNLSKIDFSNSMYESLSAIDIEYKQLSAINVSYNQLSEVPNMFLKSFVDIEEIDLSHNRLVTIELNPFEELDKLRKINMSNNYISQIDDKAFANLNALEYVDLSSNSITTVPRFTMNSGVFLHLENNPIHKIDCNKALMKNRISI